MWQVIAHLREPGADLARLGERLAPAGCVAIATPNADSLRARLQRERWENFANPTHFYYFTKGSLAKIACRAGLELVDRPLLPAVYPHHGGVRRFSQRWLRRLELSGDLVWILRRATARA
jgi:hypothetical protein